MSIEIKAVISISLLLLLLLTYVSSGLISDIKKIISDPIEEVLFSNKCIEDLGCFYTGPPFFNLPLRPISLSPSDPENIKTSFWLFTPTQKDTKFRLESSEESLAASTFDETLPTKFLIHGFRVKLESGDVRYRMKDALLEEGDYNVIVVDWTGGNGPPYVQAISNTRIVGAQIAQLITFLQRTRGIKPESVHLIGHSLGAHVAGYAGERLPTLGRISGIDPAGPFFTGTDEEVRLDPSDADFVDIIHTNIGRLILDGLGCPDPIGDLDFYPNGGKRQPMCKPSLLKDPDDGDTEGVTAMMATSCNHNAGNEYYIASIKDCTFVGTKCESYDVYEDGGCKNNTKAVMGYWAQKIPDVTPGEDAFYLDTTAEPPYCIPATSP